MTMFDKWIRRDGCEAVLTLFDGDLEREVRVPYRFEICPSCDGSGATSRGVECDGDGFTSSEWAEQDEEFRENYLSGVYDRPCDNCRPNPGRVLRPDLTRLSRSDRRAWREQCRDEVDYQRMCEMERRMGA